MSGARRRELVLDAAARAFARDGFSGTTTDAVAREAGVSQPYVVRIFGTKLDLFLAVFERASDAIVRAFQGVISAGPFDPDSDDDWRRLGEAYTDLLRDRDFLLVMMHGFTAGSVPEIAETARGCMSEVHAAIRSTGCTAEQARDFIAHGMLLNVLLAMGAPEDAGAGGPLAELTACAFGDGLETVASEP